MKRVSKVMQSHNYILLLVVVVLMMTSCLEKEPIQIGLVGTLTGPGSDLAVSGRRGAELALDKINSNGGLLGRQVELVSKDDMNDSDRAYEIAGEFIDDSIELVIGHYTSGMMFSSLDRINRNNILYLSPTVSADTLSKADDNFIRFIASTKEQADVLSKVAYHNNHENFIVLIDNKNIGFNQNLSENFESEINAYGGKVVKKIPFDELNTDIYDEVMTSMVAYETSNLFVIANSSDFASVSQNLYMNNVSVTLYGPLWAHTSDLLRLGGEAVEGAYLVGTINLECDCERFQEVRAEYKNLYGEEITFSSVFTYEAVMALAQAIEAAGTTEPNAVKTSLLEIGEFEGLQNSFLIDAYGDSVREYIVEQIENGIYRRVD